MYVQFSLSQTASNYDFVTIYDAPNDQSAQIEKLSGNLGSFAISSTGNYLFVKFESYKGGNYSGFLVAIHYGKNNIEFINSIFIENTQIMSPNYPNSYPTDAEESWLLTAPTGSIIILQFHSFHVRLIVESKNRTKFEIQIFSFTD